ncbi:MAG: type II toxin-antitoxin system RelB/DinJ family antitoxin [Deltaproteobacteria bacterium]|nr:type II toxin-antitoxin system RelB/DinJ family antitoxin [Deltaproteobacteria bacterium]
MYLMQATTMIHVRINEKTKARATKALAAMGLSVSDAVRVMLTRVASEKALPFELRVPNTTTRTAIAELDSGKGKKFSNVDELMKDLHEND